MLVLPLDNYFENEMSSNYIPPTPTQTQIPVLGVIPSGPRRGMRVGRAQALCGCWIGSSLLSRGSGSCRSFLPSGLTFHVGECAASASELGPGDSGLSKSMKRP